MASLTDSMDALTTAARPFVCGITREMPEKPVELIECGHLFDQDALRRWRAAGKMRCPECGLPSEADAAAARLERVFFRRLRRAICICASVLALGTFLLILWDLPQRDLLISGLLFVGFAIMVPLARTLARDLEISGARLPTPKDR